MALETLDRPLRYFLCIAELGSLSKAADLLDQTQSSVSKQLAGLEATLGAPLFVRTGRGVVLTEMGARLHETLRPLYRDIDAAIDEARRHSHTHGTVRVASVHTLSYYFTAEVVARFASAHPQVNLALLGRSSPDVVALVDSGKADLGFVYDVAVDVGTVISEPLFQNEMALVTRRDKPTKPGAPLRLVGFPPNYALRRMLHSTGIEATYVAEAETVDTMLQLVASGLGDCVLPSRIPLQRLAEYALCQQPLESPPLRRWVVAIRRADRPLPALAQRFLACAMQVASGLRREEKE